MEYQSFIDGKKTVDVPTGLDSIPTLNDSMFQFQTDIVSWGLSSRWYNLRMCRRCKLRCHDR